MKKWLEAAKRSKRLLKLQKKILQTLWGKSYKTLEKVTHRRKRTNGWRNDTFKAFFFSW